jgi:hypothetical protein
MVPWNGAFPGFTVNVHVFCVVPKLAVAVPPLAAMLPRPFSSAAQSVLVTVCTTVSTLLNETAPLGSTQTAVGVIPVLRIVNAAVAPGLQVPPPPPPPPPPPHAHSARTAETANALPILITRLLERRHGPVHRSIHVSEEG